MTETVALLDSQCDVGKCVSVTIAAKALAVWSGIFALAIVNGVLRETILSPVFGHAVGLVSSGVLLSVIVFAVTYVLLPWFGEMPAANYIILGLSWLCLTVAFEFAFGRLFLGRSWTQLLGAYTLEGGNIWPLVLFVVAAAPYASARIRNRV